MGRFAFVVGTLPGRESQEPFWRRWNRRGEGPGYRVMPLQPVSIGHGEAIGCLIELTASGLGSSTGVLAEACRIAAHVHGAGVVGFGLNEHLTGRLARELARATGVAVTTGHAYQVAAGLAAVQNLARRQRLNLGALSVGILSADETVGAAMARGLAPYVRELVLVGRDLAPLQTLAYRLRLERSILYRLVQLQEGGVPGVDLVVHQGEYGLIVPGGTVEIDISRVVVPGGFMPLIPGLPQSSYAEALLLALEGGHQHLAWQDDLPLSVVWHIERLAERYGVRLDVRGSRQRLTLP